MTIETSGQLCRIRPTIRSSSSTDPAAPSILEHRTGRTADAPPRRCTAGDNSSGGSNRERTGLPAGHGSGRRSHPDPAPSPRAPIRGTPRRHPPSSRRSGPGPSRSSCTAPAHRPRRRSTPTGSAYTLPASAFPRSEACRRLSPNGSALFTATASIGSVRN